MNAMHFNARITAIINSLNTNLPEMDVTSPINGKAIRIWIHRDEYLVCYTNDVRGLMGFAFKGSFDAVRNEALRLAGY